MIDSVGKAHFCYCDTCPSYVANEKHEEFTKFISRVKNSGWLFSYSPMPDGFSQFCKDCKKGTKLYNRGSQDNRGLS